MIRYQLETTSPVRFSGICARRVTKTNEGHKEEIISFKAVKGCTKIYCGSITDEHTVFDFINMFFESLSPEQEERHWGYLKAGKRIIEPGYFNEIETAEIEELRANNLDYKFLGKKLYPIFEAMYDNIKPEDIVYAANVLGALKPPSDLNTITRQGDYPEETTIDDVKYQKLAALGFIAQLTLPIHTELAEHISQVTGGEYVYSVVGDIVCKLPCIRNHPGYEVLSTYVTSSLRRQENKHIEIDIISTTKLKNNLINKGVLNKLTLTYIPSRVPGKNLSNELNSLVASKLRVKSKVQIKSLSAENNNESISHQESYKIVQEVNASDELAMAEYFTFDLIYETAPGEYAKKESGFFRHQCQGLEIKNQKLAERIYNNMPNNRVFHLTESHIKLLQLVYQGDIPYNLFIALNFDQLMCALALAQVKLFEMGFEQLAIFVTCVKFVTDAVPHLDDVYKLNNFDKEYLISICSDFDTDKKISNDNAAVRAVNEFLKEVIPAAWKSNIEEGVLGNERYVSLMSPSHEYEIYFDSRIKDELIQLIKLRNS